MLDKEKKKKTKLYLKNIRIFVNKTKNLKKSLNFRKFVFKSKKYYSLYSFCKAWSKKITVNILLHILTCWMLKNIASTNSSTTC